MLQKIIYFLLMLFFITNLYSQNNIDNIKLDSLHNKQLYFKFNNNNFLKNNEFFNRFNRGQTILGYHIIPQLEYMPQKNIKINAGIFMFNYAGKDNFYKVSPFFRFNYQITKNLNLIMGNIYGSKYHKIIEPLFSYDLELLRNDETGLQFFYNTTKIKSDLWCDWEYATVDNDTAREVMTIGNSSKYKILSNNKIEISLIYNMILHHKGGQINRFSYVQSIFNTAEGIEIIKKSKNINIGVRAFYLTYNDYSPNTKYNYTYGWANYYNLFADYKNFKLTTGFWYSEHFLNSKGDYFFSSKSSYYKNYYEPNRNIISSEVEYKQKISDGFYVNLAYEFYYDYFNFTYDYYYKLYLIFDKRFFIKKLK